MTRRANTVRRYGTYKILSFNNQRAFNYNIVAIVVEINNIHLVSLKKFRKLIFFQTFIEFILHKISLKKYCNIDNIKNEIFLLPGT